MADYSDVCDRLQEIAGVRPSRHWLSSYQSRAPSQPPNQREAAADAILRHILHQDLRSVVRETEPPSTGTNENGTPSQQWRALVRSHQSPNPQSSTKATLPESFRLMVQVEELVDVAQNSETRLGGVGVTNNGQQQQHQHQQQQRCLKLCLSDGFYETVNDDSEDPPLLFLAMEVLPIPNLSARSPAGLKILLHGPIDVRWGVLLLHEGNALVLGGSVPRLAELQRRALEAAKKQAGVGIDPTIRALVWNPLMGDEQDPDEGEQESGDVRAERNPPPPIVGPRPPTTAMPPPIVGPRPPTTTIFNPPPPNALTPTQPTTLSPPTLSLTPPPMNPTHPAQRTAPTALPRQSNTITTFSRPPSTVPLRGVNPYARNVSTTGSFRSGNNLQTGVTLTQPNANWKASHPAPIVHSQRSTNVPAPAPHNPSPPNEMLPPDSNVVPIDATGVNSTAGTIHARSNTLNLSFRQLRDLLARARQDEAWYSQHYGKVFVVSMQQVKMHHHFAIEKAKKEDRKTKKYVYAVHAEFGGPLKEEGNITCAISDAICEPYFGILATDLRQLSRVDNPRAQVQTMEGGTKLGAACFRLAQWECALYHSPDEFFRSKTDPSPPLDGKCPILLLQNRKEGAPY